jgi:hypothetical protein
MGEWLILGCLRSRLSAPTPHPVRGSAFYVRAVSCLGKYGLPQVPYPILGVQMPLGTIAGRGYNVKYGYAIVLLLPFHTIV